MTTIEFRGYSDDTAGCYWPGGDVDHDDCGAGSLRVFHVEAGDHCLAVSMVYGARAMWLIGIGPTDDDTRMPPWPMRWRFDGYSPVLAIDVPAGARVALVARLDIEHDYDSDDRPTPTWTAIA